MFKKGDKIVCNAECCRGNEQRIYEVLNTTERSIYIQSAMGDNRWYPIAAFTLHTPKQTDMNIPEGLEPFDLETALANPERVVYRNGLIPTEIHLFKTAKEYPLRSIGGGNCFSHDVDGKHFMTGPHSNDLFLRAVEVVHYFKVDSIGRNWGPYSTELSAKQSNNANGDIVSYTYRANQLVDVRIVHRFNEQL